jgi:hypothetical protein
LAQSSSISKNFEQHDERSRRNLGISYCGSANYTKE